MPERTEVHVALHYVLPPEERDTYGSLSEEAKESWRNALLGTEQIDTPDERGNYTVALTGEEISQAREARNAEYVIPTVEAHAQMVGELEPVFPAQAEANVAFPEPAMLAYHGADGVEDKAPGFVAFHLDTGLSRAAEAAMKAVKIMRRISYVGRNGVDEHGHGSMTLPLAAPDGIEATVCEVLSPNGSGGSPGIIAAIREAARYARENPDMRGKIILTGSLGGSPGSTYQPYTDACADAERAGVLCVWSAGNDGQHAVGAPGNWKPKRASIAFYRPTDRRATFSNYDASCACATEGQSVLTRNKDGQYVRANGTSFSLPDLVRCVFVVAYHAGTDVFTAFEAILSTCRNTPEPLAEEASGVPNVRAAIAKVKGGQEPDRPERLPYPELPRVAINGYDRATNREKMEMGDVVLTARRKREPFAIVRLIGRFWRGEVSGEEIDALEGEEE